MFVYKWCERRAQECCHVVDARRQAVRMRQTHRNGLLNVLVYII